MNNIDRIIVRMPNWIGDAVMAAPGLSMLRRCFPHAEITLLVKPWAAPVLANHPAVSNIIEYKPDSPLALLQRMGVVREIRKQRFNMGLLFTNSFDSALTFRAAGIPAICGYDTDGRSLLLDSPVPVPLWRGKRHEVYYYLELVKTAYVEVTGRWPDVSPDDILNSMEPIVPEPDAVIAADMILHDFTGNMTENFVLVGFNPGAAYGPAKCWPAERYRELAKRMCRDFQALKIVVFGTERDMDAGIKICSGLEDRCLNLAGKTSLAEVIALVDRMDILITNDSGLMHVGAGLQVPLVAIFGSTNPVTTGPWSDNSVVVRVNTECSPCLERECPENSFECMNNITVDMVFGAVARQLSLSQREMPQACFCNDPLYVR